MPLALYALTVGAFGIGVTEFVIMGLLIEVGADLGVSIAAAGLLISGYALGVVFGAPILTAISSRWRRKTVLIALMVIFTIGNAACALAPTYETLMLARLVAALAHGTFFGVGSVVATSLVAPERRASAIAVMFTGLTVANIAGVPFGTWLGQEYGWRMTFWAVAVVGLIALAVLAIFLPPDEQNPEPQDWRSDLATMGRPQVLIGLAVTVLGYAGVFTVFTYIAPILTQVTGFSDAAVSPILLVFGGGLILGNLVGGRLADHNLDRSILLTLLALGLSLVLMFFLLGDKSLTVALVGLVGAAGFATVAPLQMRVLEKAEGAGQALASSFNIAAFNLGNAVGAWIGGVAIDRGPGLAALPLVAAVFPLAALALSVVAQRRERKAVAHAGAC
ncbi:MFS transporter [Rhizobium wuzhouense]|uniref:MFS transporter n=1 Tax=Rhizobium wuzhouense TaxID=1986026 RepID=A0ABX5NM70_9HYPH|nr:MFS transporter [Rhizobium wuzhouense]PYB70894.1 MFS transporter [Rhizobium wuzhouense]